MLQSNGIITGMSELVRVLLADDHAVVRAGIRNALEDMPEIDIIGEVGDGPQLEQAIEELRPDFLLLDVTMPDFEPISAIRRIHAQYPDMRILVISAYDDSVYVQGLLGVGVNGYHLKDQPLQDLPTAVQRILSGERWISNSLMDKLLQPAQPTITAPKFSPRQRDILRLLAKGYDDAKIAENLGLSEKTIENHLARLYRHLKVTNRDELIAYVNEHPESIAHTGAQSSFPSGRIEAPHLEKTAILVVDDNERYRYQLRKTIGKVYPQAMIYEADSIAEAKNMAKRITPNLAFVDVVLGDEDGINCTRQIHAEAPGSRIILISAYPDREFHRRGLEAGATAFVDKKDLDAAAILQIITDAI
jgi:DNA-binding NarL/FixJ family response regulator